MAGLIGSHPQAAHIIIYHLLVIYYSVFQGIMEATAATIGNNIGQNNVQLAWFNFKLISLLSICINVVAAIMLYTYRWTIASIFTQDQNV